MGWDRSAGCTTLEVEEEPRLPRAASAEARLALAVLWWRGEPGRAGEVLLPGAQPAEFGRDDEGAPTSRLRLCRPRPGTNAPAAPLTDPFLSRRQLRVQRSADALAVEALGKRPLLLNGAARDRARVRAGDLLELERLCCFLCVERPQRLEELAGRHEFGEADAHGIVGESPAAWALRRRIAFVAPRSAHVIVTGPSGAGKELVARAIHHASCRGGKALVARNAATIPPGLADAELFGNALNYPNAGMGERPGLIGRAEGSSLFLDELGELPLDVQAHLLRVLDSGEYQRLGDARTRLANVRFLAATNRQVSELKPDLAARFALRVQLPGLQQRREDVPLLARHLLRGLARQDPALGARFLAGWNGSEGEPRLSLALVRALVLHDYSTHARELERLLWVSLQSSPGDELEYTAEVRALCRFPERGRDPEEVSREELRAALARHGGKRERAWRELGLSSRHALSRLMRKLGEV
ncbi:MAG TPA: sigma 54-interacting transcriptional regulator [Polyangiaceae bacterium]|nr:sigma 54-interacting transcriptional regulator [Polyangiaceae bacterium]